MSEELDTDELEQEVKEIYRSVAEEPDDDYHFEMGRPLAERLGYPSEDLDRVPPEALESFAGVGYHLDLAELDAGDDVLDLGSGSGTDVFVAAQDVGDGGTVTGVDMTREQLEKARELAVEHGFDAASFEHGYVEEPPLPDDSVDVVVSNGVINLSAEKQRVFDEAGRVLRAGGRFAVSDIASEKQMPDSIKSDADLWAACIGGAAEEDSYTEMIDDAGLEVTDVVENNEYKFISERAQGACSKYGVKSVSVAAEK